MKRPRKKSRGLFIFIHLIFYQITGYISNKDNLIIFNMSTSPKIIRIIVSKIEVRNVELSGIKNFPKKAWEREHCDTFGVYIYCEGKTESGQDVHFFTEKASLKKYSGIKQFERLDQNPGNFFELEIGDIIGHEKEIIPAYIENEKEIPQKVIYPYVEDKSKVVPAFKVGDKITINYDKSEIKFKSNLLSEIELLPSF